MPTGEYHNPEEALDFIYGLMQDNMGSLGLGYVGYADENLLPSYPAVVVSSGEFARELIATHKFALRFTIELWVLHAKLSITHKQRSQADMELATEIKVLLDINPTLSGNIVFGYVSSEEPGIMARSKGEAVVATRMRWIGEGRQSFV